jgi:hypothetical protein
MSDDSHIPSLDTVHGYVEKHYGRRTAKIVGGLLILGICAFALTAISSFVKPIYTAAGSVVAGRTFSIDWQPLIGPAISLVLLIALGVWVIARIRVVNHHLDLVAKFNDAQHDGLSKRVANIEQVLSNAVAPMDARIRALESTKVSQQLVDTLVKREIAAQLIIHHAFYGSPTKSNDVADTVRLHVKGNKIDMPVTNDVLGGDPHHGVAKRLSVSYSLGDGPRREVTVDEKSRLRLSADAG